MTDINDENHSFAWVNSFGTLAPTAIKIVFNLGNPTVTYMYNHSYNTNALRTRTTIIIIIKDSDFVNCDC